jgi:two-component system, NarL family, sensor kinase
LESEKINTLTLIIIGSIGMILLVVFIFVFIIIYQKKLLEHKLLLKQKDTENNEKLMKAIITTEENERQKIAANLHDEVGLNLTLLHLNQEKMLINEKFKNTNSEIIMSNIKLLENTQIDIKNIIYNLAPPALNHLGFVKALKEFANIIRRSSEINITFHENTPEKIKISIQKQIQIYRLYKEILNNIIKHAKPTLINIEIKTEESYIQLNIIHNGNGITNSIIENQIKTTNGTGLKSILGRSKIYNISVSFTSEIKSSYNVCIKLTNHG